MGRGKVNTLLPAHCLHCLPATNTRTYTQQKEFSDPGCILKRGVISSSTKSLFFKFIRSVYWEQDQLELAEMLGVLLSVWFLC